MDTSEFVNIRILDNFYQTSSFFPMPVVLISTIAESGQVNLGPYSLCFPHIVSEDHSMVLCCRSNSNTAQNIRRTEVCSINFIPFDKKYLKNCVQLGYPGDTTEEKMKSSKFTLIPSQRNQEEKKQGVQYPDIVKEAFQVFECTVNDNYPIYENEETLETHFILKLDKIILKKKWQECLLKGKGFPTLPIDYGFRDNVNFWFCKHSEPYNEKMPKEKGTSINTVMYAARRTDPDIEWTEEACAKLVKVPRIFLKTAIKGCIEKAKEEGITVMTAEFMEKIRDKRSKEKQKR